MNLIEKYLDLCEAAHTERVGRGHFCYYAFNGRLYIVAEDTAGPYPLSEDLFFMAGTSEEADRLNDERLRLTRRDQARIIGASMSKSVRKRRSH